jgi:hypothetical protein
LKSKLGAVRYVKQNPSPDINASSILTHLHFVPRVRDTNVPALPGGFSGSLGGGNAGESSRLSSPRPDPPNENGAAPDNGDIGAINEAASPPPPLSAQFPYLCKKVSRQPVPDSGVRNRLPKLPCSFDILPPFFCRDGSKSISLLHLPSAHNDLLWPRTSDYPRPECLTINGTTLQQRPSQELSCHVLVRWYFRSPGMVLRDGHL